MQSDDELLIGFLMLCIPNCVTKAPFTEDNVGLLEHCLAPLRFGDFVKPVFLENRFVCWVRSQVIEDGLEEAQIVAGHQNPCLLPRAHRPLPKPTPLSARWRGIPRLYPAQDRRSARN